MTANVRKENWFLVLGIDPFDSRMAHDKEKLQEIIERKDIYWNSHFQDFENGEKYRRWHDALQQIRSDMLQQPNVRMAMQKEAQELLCRAVDRDIRFLGRESEVYPEKVKEIARRQKVSEELVEQRLLKSGRFVVAEDRGAELLEELYRRRPDKYDRFWDMKGQLETFAAADLYDFLGQVAEEKDPRRMTCAELRALASDRSKSEFFGYNTVSSSGKKLCGQAEEIFRSEAGRKEYDTFLAYVARKEILEDMRSCQKLAGMVHAENYREFLDRMTDNLKDREKADLLLRAFARQEMLCLEAEAGTDVKAGSMAEELQAKLTESKAKLMDAKAKLSETKVQLTETKAKLTEIRTKLSETKAQLTETRTKLSETKAQLTETRTKLSETKAQLTETRAQLTEARAQGKVQGTPCRESEPDTSQKKSPVPAPVTGGAKKRTTVWYTFTTEGKGIFGFVMGRRLTLHLETGGEKEVMIPKLEVRMAEGYYPMDASGTELLCTIPPQITVNGEARVDLPSDVLRRPDMYLGLFVADAPEKDRWVLKRNQDSLLKTG